MKVIILSFSLKGQEFSEIKKRILEIKQHVGDDVMLIHGFMPRMEIEKRSLSQEVNDFFDEHFPVQANFYNGGVLRKGMADMAEKLDAEIFVIGEIKGGISEEVELYRERNLKIVKIPLNGEKLKFGEVVERINTWEDMLSETGRPDVPEFSDLPEDLRTFFKAVYKNVIMVEAYNEGGKMDIYDRSKNRYYPYFETNGSPSGFRFIVSYCVRSSAGAGSGSRLSFKNEKLSNTVGKKHADIFREMLES